MHQHTIQERYASTEKWTRNTERHQKQTNWNVGSYPEKKQSEAVTNNIMSQTTKPELAQYRHISLFIPTTGSLLKSIKQGFLKTWPGLTKNLIKKNLEKSRNTKNRAPAQ